MKGDKSIFGGFLFFIPIMMLEHFEPPTADTPKDKEVSTNSFSPEEQKKLKELRGREDEEDKEDKKGADAILQSYLLTEKFGKDEVLTTDPDEIAEPTTSPDEPTSDENVFVEIEEDIPVRK